MSGAAERAVLVVEDEVLIRLDLVELLEQAGFRTHEAGNAADAIKILESHPEIRVVITDIQMPGDMDGLALSHYVRKRWPPTIIVVCSANELAGLDVLPGDAMFLSKPYLPDTMTEIMTRLTRQLAAR